MKYFFQSFEILQSRKLDDRFPQHIPPKLL
jgi:hypothetical protein